MKCSPKSITFAASVLASCVICGSSAHAKDETAAVYVQGMGGSLSTNDGQSRGGLGLQAGAQLLFLEAYASQTAFANDAIITRAVMGSFFDLSLGRHWELSLHFGVGGIRDTGGALFGEPGTGSNTGAVARIGMGIERDLGSFFVLGASLDTESFAVKPSAYEGVRDWRTGSSVFLSGHLKFELGI